MVKKQSAFPGAARHHTDWRARHGDSVPANIPQDHGMVAANGFAMPVSGTPSPKVEAAGATVEQPLMPTTRAR